MYKTDLFAGIYSGKKEVSYPNLSLSDNRLFFTRIGTFFSFFFFFFSSPARRRASCIRKYTFLPFNAYFMTRIFTLHDFAFYSIVVEHFTFARINVLAVNTHTLSKWYTACESSPFVEFTVSHLRTMYHYISDNSSN